jgi:hypothetical protein
MPGGGQLDLHLTGDRVADLDLLDRPLLAHAPQDRALGLHVWCSPRRRVPGFGRERPLS